MLKQIISTSLLTTLFGLVSFSAIAQTDPFPESIQVLGRGIQNKVTEELLLLACVGNYHNEVEGINCDQVRFVRFEKNSTPYWMGESFASKNIYLLSQDLKEMYRSSFKIDLFSLYRGQQATAFTNRDGWNWSSTPVVVSEPDFKRLLMSSLYYGANRRYDDSKSSRAGNHNFEIGESVYVSNSLEHVYRVDAILPDGQIKLSSGVVALQTNLSHPAQQFSGFKIHQEVFIRRGDKQITRVQIQAIADNGVIAGTYMDAGSGYDYDTHNFTADKLMPFTAIEAGNSVVANCRYPFAPHSFEQYQIVGKLNSGEQILRTSQWGGQDYFAVQQSYPLISNALNLKVGDSAYFEGKDQNGKKITSEKAYKIKFFTVLNHKTVAIFHFDYTDKPTQTDEKNFGFEIPVEMLKIDPTAY